MAGAVTGSSTEPTYITEELLRSRTGEFDVANIVRLDLSNLNIFTIHGLELCPRLVELSLANNRIARIDNVNHLKNLRKLVLTNNRISSIENLDHMFSLEHLHLQGNQISQVENLANLNTLPRLHSLYLADVSGANANPVCEQRKYGQVVRQYLPDLKILDGQRVAAAELLYAGSIFDRPGLGNDDDGDGVQLPPQQTWIDDPHMFDGLMGEKEMEDALAPAIEAFRQELLQCKRACAAANSVITHYESTSVSLKKGKSPSASQLPVRPPSSKSSGSATSNSSRASSRAARAKSAKSSKSSS